MCWKSIFNILRTIMILWSLWFCKDPINSIALSAVKCILLYPRVHTYINYLSGRRIILNKQPVGILIIFWRKKSTKNCFTAPTPAWELHARKKLFPISASLLFIEYIYEISRIKAMLLVDNGSREIERKQIARKM